MTENKNVFKSVVKEITQPFVDLFSASRALWGINVSYLLEGLTYFGILGLLAMYFNEYIGLNDILADQMVSILAAGITLSMLFLGSVVDLVGVRKSMLISLALMLVGRVLLSATPGISSSMGLWSVPHLLALFGILWIVLGYGIYQPACYTAVKQFTNKNTSAMGYAMLYALMNLGGFLPGFISPPVRKAIGISGVFWLYSVLTIVGMAAVTILLTKKAIKKAQEENKDIDEEQEIEEKKPIKEQIKYYIKNFPIKDKRFMFFIFILIPVQTLFAHNWLTPMIAAFTAKKNTYKMMIYGTMVMGLAPFILVSGPNITALFSFIIVMTIGEAMWQPRFLQWVADIAPKGMTGIYMGLGQFPWFLTKVVTGLYAGWFLMNYCPDNSPLEALKTQEMWLIYGGIAMISPIALIFARSWMLKGFKERLEANPEAKEK